MTTSILLLTHGCVGQSMLKAATNTLGELPPNVLAMSISRNRNVDSMKKDIEKIINNNNAHAMLILTDLFGSTPCNLASKFAEQDNIAVISGVNLGMLLKSINYIHLSLDELIPKVVDGGKACIKLIGNNNNDN